MAEKTKQQGNKAVPPEKNKAASVPPYAKETIPAQTSEKKPDAVPDAFSDELEETLSKMFSDLDDETEIEIPSQDDNFQDFTANDTSNSAELNKPQPAGEKIPDDVTVTSVEVPSTNPTVQHHPSGTNETAETSMENTGAGTTSENIEIPEAPLSDDPKSSLNQWVLAAAAATMAAVFGILLLVFASREEGKPPQTAVDFYKISPSPAKQPAPVPAMRTETITDQAEPPTESPVAVEIKKPANTEAIDRIVKQENAVPEPAEIKAPVMKFPYALLGGSYRSMESATRLVETFRFKGLQSYWVKVDLADKGVWFRVFVGGFPTAEAATETITIHQLKGLTVGRIKYANFIDSYRSEEKLLETRRFLAENGYDYSSYFIKDEDGRFHLYVGTSYKIKNAENIFKELDAKGIRSQIVER